MTSPGLGERQVVDELIDDIERYRSHPEGTLRPFFAPSGAWTGVFRAVSPNARKSNSRTGVARYVKANCDSRIVATALPTQKDRLVGDPRRVVRLEFPASGTAL